MTVDDTRVITALPGGALDPDIELFVAITNGVHVIELTKRTIAPPTHAPTRAHAHTAHVAYCANIVRCPISGVLSKLMKMARYFDTGDVRLNV